MLALSWLAGCQQPKGIEGRWTCESTSVEVVGDGYVKLPWVEHKVSELNVNTGKSTLNFGKNIDFAFETKKVEGTKIYVVIKLPEEFKEIGPVPPMILDAPGDGTLLVTEFKDKEVDWANLAAAKVRSTQKCRR